MAGKEFILRLLIFTVVIFTGTMISVGAAAPEKVKEFRTVTKVYDWGAAVPYIIIDLGETVKKDAIQNDTFSVYVKRTVVSAEEAAAYKEAQKDISAMAGVPQIWEGDREITKVYVSDESGKAVNKGRYITIEMKIGPMEFLSQPLAFDMKTMRNKWVQLDYNIAQHKDIKADKEVVGKDTVFKFTGNESPDIAMFKYGEGTYDGHTLSYASYEPKKSKNGALIIWLHGMGEGGTDPTIPISANRANAFAGKEWQEAFGGAFVLVPQAPTYWMHGFKGFGDGTSIYEVSLMELIKDYVSKHKAIDANRIYVGGDSNGGYMTMLLVRDYPGVFAAGFPTCEALSDSLISQSDIKSMATTPIWFTAAKTDEVVLPERYTAATYKRLLDAGMKDVHFSFFDNVHDMTGLYKQENKRPFEYNGHWSWIYVYNNECIADVDGNKISLRDWLVKKRRFRAI